QALDMTALVEGRSRRPAMLQLAERIERSQQDEIAMMQDWLGGRGLPVPGLHAHHEEGFEPMPGMLAPEELAGLADLEGFEFDAMFLRLMIRHHQGALTMVEDLLDQPGSAQDSALFAFVSDITSDQGDEIERMAAMLAGFSP